MKRDLIKVKTVKQALEVVTPTISEIRKAYGEVKVEAYIKLWLIEFNEMINVSRHLKKHQINECAFMIVTEYYLITIADINNIFRSAKKGEYGEFYESLSINKILGWFGDYFNEKCNEVAEINRNKHKETKKLFYSAKGNVLTERDMMRKAQIRYIKENHKSKGNE